MLEKGSLLRAHQRHVLGTFLALEGVPSRAGVVQTVRNLLLYYREDVVHLE